jgi:hypothetical protein
MKPIRNYITQTHIKDSVEGWSKRIYNLTPHPINIFTQNNTELYIPPCGIVARRQFVRKKVAMVGAIPIYDTSIGKLRYEDFLGNIVPFIIYPDNIYVVSRITLGDGEDTPTNFYAPGEPVKAGDGQLIGAYGLTRY